MPQKVTKILLLLASLLSMSAGPRTSTLFDHYLTRIGIKAENERLKNYAHQLRNTPNSRGLIVVYAAGEKSQKSAKARGQRAYMHVVKTHGIEQFSNSCTKRYGARVDHTLDFPTRLSGCVVEHEFSLEQVLPLVTSNTAGVLKLPSKGAIDTGKDADIVVMHKDSLEIVDVIAGGRRLVSDGRLNVEESFLKHSTRKISLHGTKHDEGT